MTDADEPWIDPDDAPPLDEAFFATAEHRIGSKIIRRGTPAVTAALDAVHRRRGRPKVGNPKMHITLRLDADVIESFRATGKGWQTRMNDALRRAMEL